MEKSISAPGSFDHSQFNHTQVVMQVKMTREYIEAEAAKAHMTVDEWLDAVRKAMP